MHKAWGSTNDKKYGIQDLETGKYSNGNKEESSSSNKRYCNANHDKLSGDCKFCLRNFSRCYSEGDASVILNASSLLASSQIDSNNLKKITPPTLRQTIGDVSCNNNIGTFLRNKDKPQSNISR